MVDLKKLQKEVYQDKLDKGFNAIKKWRYICLSKIYGWMEYYEKKKKIGDIKWILIIN